MKLIPLSGKHGVGLFAIVSDEDFDRVSIRTWNAHLDYTTRNTRRNIYAKRKVGTNKNVYLHHEIIGKKPGLVVDHINRNTLDNTRENLRHVTFRENALNHSSYTSSREGLGATKVGKKWQAQARINGKTTYLGLYPTKEEAHLVYLKAKEQL
jgi:hypothetical protein